MPVFNACTLPVTFSVQTLATTTYVANMMFIMLSIAIFLRRIAAKRQYTWTLKTSMVVIFLRSLVIFLYEIFQCTSVQAQWDFTIKNFRCVSGDSFVAAAPHDYRQRLTVRHIADSNDLVCQIDNPGQNHCGARPLDGNFESHSPAKTQCWSA